MKKYNKILLALFCLISANYIHSQISNGGIPYTFQNNIPKTLIETHEIAKPAASLINSISDEKGPYKIISSIHDIYNTFYNDNRLDIKTYYEIIFLNNNQPISYLAFSFL